MLEQEALDNKAGFGGAANEVLCEHRNLLATVSLSVLLYVQ
jgi:hypothetical protein